MDPTGEITGYMCGPNIGSVTFKRTTDGPTPEVDTGTPGRLSSSRATSEDITPLCVSFFLCRVSGSRSQSTLQQFRTLVGRPTLGSPGPLFYRDRVATILRLTERGDGEDVGTYIPYRLLSYSFVPWNFRGIQLLFP